MYRLVNHFVLNDQGYFFTQAETQKAVVWLQKNIKPDGIIFYTREMENRRLEKKAKGRGLDLPVLAPDAYYFVFRNDSNEHKTTLLEIHPAILGEQNMTKVW